jgi:hypothetical protein
MASARTPTTSAFSSTWKFGLWFGAEAEIRFQAAKTACRRLFGVVSYPLRRLRLDVLISSSRESGSHLRLRHTKAHKMSINLETEELEERIGKVTAPSTRDAKPHERARLALAAGFSLTYLLIMLLMASYSIFWDYDQQTLAAISSAILSPLGALVGGIIGFYFGTKKGE